MISDILKKAREYEADYNSKSDLSKRPLFHVTGTVGWINDPNGFSVYKGEYHLFYQYHPYSLKWGPMHWGHLKSKDLIKWERLPVALAPDEEYDINGCFSGSAVETPDGKHLLMYTGVQNEYQRQCIAVGDGSEYTKVPVNPVIKGDMLPKGSSEYDFRDPKIRIENGIYYAVVANKAADGSGAVYQFSSLNGNDWIFDKVVDASKNELGKMWECPDYFPFMDKRVLILSPQEMEAGGEFKSGNNTMAIIGNENQEGAFIRESIQTLDFGIDFYAPQTLKSPDGRQIFIAWMQSWENCDYKMPEADFFGEMTIPRELFFKDGRLCQKPVREIENYYDRKYEYKGIEISGETSLDGVSGRTLDLSVNLKNVEGGFEICLAKNKDYQTRISIDESNNTLIFDRSLAGMPKEINNTCTINLLSKVSEGLSLRILMDRYSIELFINGGEQSASFMIYTPAEAESISFSASKATSADILGCTLLDIL